jgi:uncharacterized protein YbjT (DUF2867 family)
MNALILGATGLVGGHCLKGLIDSPACTGIVALTRRPLETGSSKVIEQSVSFDALESFTPPIQIDHVFCAFGTTIKKAGSQEAMYHIDVEIPLQLARRMRSLGASRFSLVSSLGANARSKVFYNRIKGELEDAIRALEFDSTLIVRPSIIGGKRKGDERGAESLMQTVMRIAPKSVRTIPAEMIAGAMIQDALRPRKGTKIMLSKEIWDAQAQADVGS